MGYNYPVRELLENNGDVVGCSRPRTSSGTFHDSKSAFSRWKIQRPKTKRSRKKKVVPPPPATPESKRRAYEAHMRELDDLLYMMEKAVREKNALKLACPTKFYCKRKIRKFRWYPMNMNI